MKKADFSKFAPLVKLLAHGLVFVLIIFRVGFLLVRRQAIKLFLKRRIPGEQQTISSEQGNRGRREGERRPRSAGETPSPTDASR